MTNTITTASQQMQSLPDFDLAALVQEAEAAFWEVIAMRFPEATTGDLCPMTSARLSIAQEAAVKEWIACNVTTQQSHLEPGYRFRLFHEVERFPDFAAKSGLTGTVTQIDNSGVWGRMDEHITGAEHWENQIHWKTPEAFASDTEVA
jgi:hypothetical protein